MKKNQILALLLAAVMLLAVLIRTTTEIGRAS